MKSNIDLPFLRVVNKYSITNMTCGSCVTKVRETLANYEEIESLEVLLECPQEVITSLI